MLVLAVVGPYTRSALGENVTMTDVVAQRFGYVMQVYIGLISVFYQFISLASELTCVAQLTTMFSPNAHSLIPILVVVFLTNLYLIIGGLRASLATDVWQGIGVIALLAVVCIAMCFHVAIPEGAWSRTNVAAFTVEGFETLVTLVIAVTASICSSQASGSAFTRRTTTTRSGRRRSWRAASSSRSRWRWRWPEWCRIWRTRMESCSSPS